MIEFANDGEMLTVGKLLKNERERQDLTLEDISDRTKINVKYLSAIEEERKDQFPGELYQELFTKSYAEALGLEYSKIKAGTFASTRSRKDSDTKGRAREESDRDRSRKNAKAKSRPGVKEIRPEKRPTPQSAPYGNAIEFASAGVEPAADQESNDAAYDAAGEGKPSTKPDIMRYLLITAAIIICLFIVFLYISISSREPAGRENQTEGQRDIRRNGQTEEAAMTDQLAAIDDSVRSVMRWPAGADSSILLQEHGATEGLPEDSLAEGPVSIYPESLEVKLVSSESSWVSVTADGGAPFRGYLRSDEVNTFKALRELDFELGNWDIVSGTIYGHSLKAMRSLHVPGNNAVRFTITKDNWESFIDSTKPRNEQN